MTLVFWWGTGLGITPTGFLLQHGAAAWRSWGSTTRPTGPPCRTDSAGSSQGSPQQVGQQHGGQSLLDTLTSVAWAHTRRNSRWSEHTRSYPDRSQLIYRLCHFHLSGLIMHTLIKPGCGLILSLSLSARSSSAAMSRHRRPQRDKLSVGSRHGRIPHHRHLFRWEPGPDWLPQQWLRLVRCNVLFIDSSHVEMRSSCPPWWNLAVVMQRVAALFRQQKQIHHYLC